MKRLWLCSLVAALAVSTAMGGGDKKAKDANIKETDPKTWTPVKIPGQQKAPEFEDIDTWLNSPPLTMKELRGKVVIVHFMAFG